MGNRTEQTPFLLGDRIMLVKDHPDGNMDLVVGARGYVCSEDRGNWIPVCWDYEIEAGHDCDGECEDGHGWCVSHDDIVLEEIAEIDDEDIADDSELRLFIGIKDAGFCR